VTHYRAYTLDKDGHIWKGVDLVLNDDEEAIEAVTQLVTGQDMELWERNRKVACFKRKDREPQ